MTAAATLRGFLPACTSRRDRRPARDARVASWTDDRRVSAGGTPGPSEARRCQGTGSWGSGARRVSIAPIRCVSTPAKTSGSQSSQKTRPDPSLVEVRESTVSNELRAAAAARALSFYTYPADRSEFSVRAHRNMRIDAEWDAIRAKIAGEDVAFRDCRVACVVAVMDLPRDGSPPPGWDPADLDPASVVPGGSDGYPGADDEKGLAPPPRVVLGTLDVNQGVKLPAEELAGTKPAEDDPTPPRCDLSEDGKGTNAKGYGNGETLAEGAATTGGAGEKTETLGVNANARPTRYRRAYLSNVCVLPAARRAGLGKMLMEEAFEVARGWGVERMYVHVVNDNHAARAFYAESGFEVEAEETAAQAAALSRPPRILLAQDIAY